MVPVVPNWSAYSASAIRMVEYACERANAVLASARNSQFLKRPSEPPLLPYTTTKSAMETEKSVIPGMLGGFWNTVLDHGTVRVSGYCAVVVAGR